MARARRPPPEPVPPAGLTRDEFLAWRAPRLGTANPERLTNPVWSWLVRERLNAWAANKAFDGPSSLGGSPCWCNTRFGQSRTALEDGRTILIGGEHEDYYDPDFFIYNDVIVTDATGAIEIYGYPRDVFPPTDFHSATLDGDRIVIVGCLGYTDQRARGTTPVYALALGDLSIARLETTGDAPGWIYEHAATRDGEALVVRGGMRYDGTRLVESFDDWALDLGTLRWTRSSARPWSIWQLVRTDGKSNKLFDITSYALYEHGRDKAVERIGFTPDIAQVTERYAPPMMHVAQPPHEDDDFRVHRIEVAGVVVRYTEDMAYVTVTIEGELPEATVDALIDDARRKLSAIERTEYVARRIVP